MQNTPLQNEVKAIEVLSFSHAELQKNDNDKNKISRVGILSVLHFPEFNRYILFLDDWSYALLRRLPVIASGEPFSNSRCYTFPAYTGNYVVRLNKIIYPEAIKNFETILEHNSHFSYEGEHRDFHQGQASPSDKFTAFEQHGDSYREKGIPHTETGKLRGKEKLKRGFKKVAIKFRSHYSASQKSNANLTRVMDYSELKSSGVDPAHFHDLGRIDIEAIIIRSKDIANSRGYLPTEQGITKPGVESYYEAKETIVKMHQDKPLTLREAELLSEIENERRLQELERKHQESHKQKELLHTQKERELQESIKAQQQQSTYYKLKQREQPLLPEVQHKDTVTLEQAKLRSDEVSAFSKREKQLHGELELQLAELRRKERLTEDERAEIVRKESELDQLVKLREAELLAISQTQKRIRERAEIREAELREKMRLTEKEHLELEEIKKTLAQATQLHEQERRNLELKRHQLLREAENREAQMLERERLAEAERLELEEKEKRLEVEHELRLFELRLKEQLNEQERLELQGRERELSQFAEMKEIDLKIKQRQCQQEAELIAQNEKLINDTQEMNKELREMYQELNSRRQNISQSQPNIQESQQGMGQIDLANLP